MAPARPADGALLSVVRGGDQAEVAEVKICIDCNERPAFARKRCTKCYPRWWRSETFRKIQNAAHLTCSECDKPAHAMGLCQTHYMRLYRHGDPNVVYSTHGALVQGG